MLVAALSEHLACSLDVSEHPTHGICADVEVKTAEAMLDRLKLGQLSRLNNALTCLDTSMSGQISSQEVMAGAANVARVSGMSANDLKGMLAALADSSGNVPYRRFMAKVLRAQRGFDTHALWEHFCEFDVERSGFLNLAEVRQLMVSLGCREDEAEGYIHSMSHIRHDSHDGESYVSFDEVKHAVMGADAEG